MVRLTRIYTRGGDRGMTSLVDGTRLSKNHPRMAAIGGADETNALVGLARLHTAGEADEMLARIQNDLFDLGADLATPLTDSEGDGASALRIVAAQVDRLESEIDRINRDLTPLQSFILPGGAAAAAWLHLARTVCRRAERSVVALMESERVNPLVLAYLNRLSDHAFVLSRRLNDGGKRDLLWVPGKNR